MGEDEHFDISILGDLGRLERCGMEELVRPILQFAPKGCFMDKYIRFFGQLQGSCLCNGCHLESPRACPYGRPHKILTIDYSTIIQRHCLPCLQESVNGSGRNLEFLETLRIEPAGSIRFFQPVPIAGQTVF